jgi:hypothetical protein
MVNLCLLSDLQRHSNGAGVDQQAVFHQEARQTESWHPTS